jgi:hypothetical protein
MGPRVLVAASNIQGFYILNRHELILSADIDAGLGLYDFAFVRVPWIGALKFNVEGWILSPPDPSPESAPQSAPEAVPENAIKKTPIENKFNISLATVIVADRNHPEGVAIDVHVVGGILPPPNLTKGESNGEAPTEIDDFSPQEIKIIDVLYKGTFTLKQSADVPKFGSVNITSDPAFLTLEKSGISNGDIFWTFEGAVTGHTQVIVTVYGGIANYVQRIVYDVNIFFPNGPGPVIIQGGSEKHNIQAKPDGTAGEVSVLPPIFIDRIGTGRDIVLKQFPDAQLYEVIGRTNNPKGVYSTYELPLVNLVFRIKDGTVLIKSSGYFTWEHPVVVSGPPPLGLNNISWPIEFTPDQATDQLRHEGYKGQFVSVRIEQLLKDGNPRIPGGIYYIFTLVDGTEVRITPYQS